VLDALFAERTVLPAPPGTVFRGRDALAEWLELHYFTLVEALNFVDGRAVARVTARPVADEAHPRPGRAPPDAHQLHRRAGDRRARGERR
jgi:hypothetical protein